MKTIAEKCHLFVSSHESCIGSKTEDFRIKNSTEEKLLWVKFSSNLSLENMSTLIVKKQARH